jgi:hypothetical protein
MTATQEAAMDDEKKPITEAFADTVKSIIDTSAAAAMRALTPDPTPDTNEAQEYREVQGHTDAAATPAPLFPKKKRTAPKRANKRVAAQKTLAKKASKKAAKKSKKSAKAAPKKSAKKAPKKAAKKASKKASKKSKKKSKR